MVISTNSHSFFHPNRNTEIIVNLGRCTKLQKCKQQVKRCLRERKLSNFLCIYQALTLPQISYLPQWTYLSETSNTKWYQSITTIQNPLSFWRSLENIWKKQSQPPSRGKLPLLRSLEGGGQLLQWPWVRQPPLSRCQLCIIHRRSHVPSKAGAPASLHGDTWRHVASKDENTGM